MLTTTSANNYIYLCDLDATAGYNTESIIDYLAYYQTAALLPQFTAGSLSEAALWSGDQTSKLATLYGSGTRISVKTLCGVVDNYVKWVRQTVEQEGITSSPTTTSAGEVLLADMERFVYGEKFLAGISGSFGVTTIGETGYFDIFIDGKMMSIYNNYFSAAVSGGAIDAGYSERGEYAFGLHKFEGRWATSSTIANSGKCRKLLIQEIE